MTAERSVSDVLQDILSNLQDIIRSEVRLAKAEVREDIRQAAAAGIWLVVGMASGLAAAIFLLWTGVYGLAMFMPLWASTLVAALVMGAAAAVLMAAGLRKLKRINPVPERTVHTMKEHVEWIKQSAK